MVSGYGEAEYVDKKSRFIGQVAPATTEAEAMAFIESVRKKHADATHNVWCYHLKDGNMRRSDDGEPGGTAGQPSLNVFISASVFDVCCVVTRYFGGTLLGAGGLVRAYSKAATLGLDAAGIAKMAPWTCIATDCTYALYERVIGLLESMGAAEVVADFHAEVTVSAILPENDVTSYANSLKELSAGRAKCVELDKIYRAGKVK